jgi:hypothetical protein
MEKDKGRRAKKKPWSALGDEQCVWDMSDKFVDERYGPFVDATKGRDDWGNYSNLISLNNLSKIFQVPLRTGLSM